jgi:hypothetical protein
MGELSLFPISPHHHLHASPSLIIYNFYKTFNINKINIALWKGWVTIIMELEWNLRKG